VAKWTEILGQLLKKKKKPPHKMKPNKKTQQKKPTNQQQQKNPMTRSKTLIDCCGDYCFSIVRITLLRLKALRRITFFIMFIN